MKDTIKIFVGGSTELKEQRDFVRAIATEIHSICHDYGQQVSIIVKSCDELGSGPHQNNFNTYIAEKADLVFFILKDSMGEKTIEEYEIAAKQYASSQRPDFYVFLKQFQTKTQEIKAIEDVMQHPSQAYYTQYSDDKDLKVKIKDHIERLVNKLISNKVINELDHTNTSLKEKDNEILEQNLEIDRLNRKKRKQWVLAMLTSILSLGFIGYTLYQNYIFKPKPMLLFAGGGSVVNFIDSVSHKDLKKYPNSIYVNQASGNAWTLLVEDAFIDGEKTFFPICLSADTIDKNYINARYSSKVNPGYIIGIKLGDDPLAVYIDNLTAKKWNYPLGLDSTILVQDLSEKINEINEINKNNKKKRVSTIFSTSSNSGTLRAYQHAIKKYYDIHFDEMIDDTLSYLFFDESPRSYYNDIKQNLPYIVLGSKIYRPDSLLLNESLTRLFVKDTTGLIKKPIYIYFRVNNNVENEKNKFKIEKQIVDFLIKINANRNNDIRQWNNITTKSILQLDSLKKYVHYLN